MRKLILFFSGFAFVMTVTYSVALADLYVNGHDLHYSVSLGRGCSNGHHTSGAYARCEDGYKGSINFYRNGPMYERNYCELSVWYESRAFQSGRWHANLKKHGLNCSWRWENDNTIDITRVQ